MLRFLFCLSCRKPKIVFGEPRVGAGDNNDDYVDDSVISWYIPIINERLTDFRKYICRRDEAENCIVEVNFTIYGKPFSNTTWWDNPRSLKTLSPDSKHNEVSIVSMTSDGEIHLAGTFTSTANLNIPPSIVPIKTDIMADMSIKSREKVLAKSKWCIVLTSDHFSPVIIERV